jgi:tetratricopeptide (TPR) repeat protein
MMKRIFIFASTAATLPVLGMVTSAIAQSGVQSGDGFVTAGGVLPAGMTSPMDPADRLASSLRLLAQNPYDIGALTQAGESALAVGDANAAIGFLARAEGLSPTNGRIKSSLASALVLVERPNEALRLFSEAQALGIPETGLARDRGLAYDLSGDPKRAQRDYHLVLRSRGDDEVTRRLALSMGIAGEKDAALKQLEPLIRKRDQAAWRARAFIMAMNGDRREDRSAGCACQYDDKSSELHGAIAASDVLSKGLCSQLRHHAFPRHTAICRAIDRSFPADWR